jgi:hypothetical protein
VRWFGVLLLAGSCGRLGFDPVSDGDFVAACDKAPEPNDSFADATPLAFDAEATALLCQGDRDVYAIDLLAGEEVSINISADGPGWPTIELVDADDVPRAVRTYASSMTGFADRDGRYYVRVAGVAATNGTAYRVTVDKLAGRHIFIAPSGDDLGPGTFAQPLQHFGVAISRLVPGDTLVLLDGNYSEPQNDRVRVHCDLHQSGSATEPIRVVAFTDRRAFVLGDGVESTFRIDSGCAYWSIEGLHLENQDNATSNNGTALNLENTSHITVRRILARHNNRYINSHVIEVADSSDILVEDTEIYDFHRDGLLFFGVQRGTARRVLAASRGYADVAGGYPSGPTDKGDTGIAVGHCRDVVVENTISVGNGADTNDAGYGVDCTDTHYFGDIAIGNDYGFISSIISNGAQNTIRTRYESCIAIDARYDGFYVRSNMDGSCTGCTTINSQGHGWQADQLSTQPRTSSSSCINCLAVGSVQTGFYIQQQTGGWSLDHVNAFGNATQFNPTNAPEMTSPMQRDPQLGGCLAYQPANAPLRGAGKNGGTIGGEVVYRYQDGLLTGTPLWDPITGAFPCGAVVAGVNDDPATSCIGIHQRLHVGTSDCPLPYPEL